MNGLASLKNLRVLNLSFNRITALQGISSLYYLQHLDLGKNYIASADALIDVANPLLHLQEVYLYMNELRSFPRLSLPQLKILTLNRNQDLE